jgi:hypothetical protein
MSHVVEIQTEIRDPVAVQAACQRLKLPPPTQGSFELFSGACAGLGVQLPDWRYPVVCDTATGQVRYDNFEGRWGNPAHLNGLLQSYAVEKAKLEARKQGHSVSEQTLADGSIKVVVQVGGAA